MGLWVGLNLQFEGVLTWWKEAKDEKKEGKH
jgi:hypothetical protein